MMKEMEEEDVLKSYRTTYKTYNEIKKYFAARNITKDTPFPIVAVWINSCIKQFKKWENDDKYIFYPKEKILNLCLYYLNSINYENK